VVEPDPAAHTTTLLKYEISLEPKLSIPSAIVTCVVKAGLPANMMAMARRAEQASPLIVWLSCSVAPLAFKAHCSVPAALCSWQPARFLQSVEAMYLYLWLALV